METEPAALTAEASTDVVTLCRIKRPIPISTTRATIALAMLPLKQDRLASALCQTHGRHFNLLVQSNLARG